MPAYPKIVLRKGKERSLQNFHPWLFSGAVYRLDKALTEGCVAEVFTHDDRYVATAHYHPGNITARVLSFSRRAVDQAFFDEKLAGALAYRRATGYTVHSAAPAYRLVHGEGDGLPGLVVDLYHETAVVQAHTTGMRLALPLVVQALRGLEGAGLKSVYLKGTSAAKAAGDVAADGYLYGDKQEGLIVEHGLRFRVHWEEGQKTGFYLDQRDNRRLLLDYAKGRKMLNGFAYSGAFSVYGLQGGATVDSVDSSRQAGKWIAENVGLNFPDTAGHRFFESDVLAFLKAQQERYDLVVLDPPAYAKRLGAVDQAVIGYRNLNHEAFLKMAPGGILFTFSCSQVIDTALFRKVVFMAAAQAKRSVRIMHRLSQGADHPVSLFHPEGEYLKGLVLFVE